MSRFPSLRRLGAAVLIGVLAAGALTAVQPAEPANATIASEETRALTLINSNRAKRGLPKFATSPALQTFAHRWMVENQKSRYSGGTLYDAATAVLPEDGATGSAPRIDMDYDYSDNYDNFESTTRAESAARLMSSGYLRNTRAFSHAAVGLVQVGRRLHIVMVVANYPECYPRTARSAKPTISGTGRVGDVLTANPGAWSPSSLRFTYSWTSNGRIVGQGRTYIPTPDDLATSIAVTVEGARTCYVTPTPRASDSVTVIQGKRPVIVGERNVGSTLRVEPGTWTVSDLTFVYQWLRNGAPIQDASTAEYVVQPDDRGALLTARVTGSAAGYSATKTTATAPATAAPRLGGSSTPYIEGEPRYDATLTADPGPWGSDPATLTYQWRINGARMIGATGKTFVVPYRAIGKRITLTVTERVTGFAPRSTTSSATAIVGAGKFTEETIEMYVSGSPVVGSVFRAYVSTEIEGELVFGSTRAVMLSFQWYRNGAAIAGATRPHFVIRDSDLGTDISVVATTRRIGYEPFEIVSPPQTIGSGR